MIVNIARNIQNMHHLNNRARGFLSYFSKSGENRGNKITINILSTDTRIVKNSFEKVFRKNPDIASIFVTGSKSYKIAEYLHSASHNSINVIGYDLLEKNVTLLKEGLIRFIIGQRPEEQTFRAVKKLFDFLSLNKVPDKMEYLPIDIVTSENVDFFSNNH
jgi:LacI family transcriptional regulator